MNNLFELLTEFVSDTESTETALYWLDRKMSWQQVEAASRRVAGGLQALGIQEGDRVAVMLPNIPPYLFIELGTLMIGAILVPVHVFMRGEELGYLLDDSEAKVLFSWSGYKEVADQATGATESLRHRIEIDGGEGSRDFQKWMQQSTPYAGDPIGGGDDVAFIRYTAGVTGRPKGAMITHNNVLLSSEETLRALHIRHGESMLAGMPFYHPFGSTLQIYMVFRARASLILQTRFDPVDAYRIVVDEKVKIIIGLPSVFTSFVEMEGTDEDPGELAFVISGGGPLDAQTIYRFENIYKTKVCTVYGTCETSPTICVNDAHFHDTPRDSFGRPISSMDVRIVNEKGKECSIGDVGEIQVKGAGVFKGYWNKRTATDITFEDGWFKTSDLGRIDIDGWVYGVGRMHDRINKGGFSVYPREVEGVINAHPMVFASAVIGEDEPVVGEDLVAYVVPRAGNIINERDLMEYCEERLARYKIPRRIIVVKKLPRSPSGVVLRRALREGWSDPDSE